MLQTPRSIVRRTSSPFVSRPVRRHTISGCSRRMGAPAFSVSGFSVSALGSSLATLTDTTNVNGDVRHLPPDWEQQRDVPSMAPHGTSASRAHGALPPHAATYERDPELPVGLGAQPSVDLGIVLEELSRRTSRYCINLNKLVDRDERFTARHGSSALVYRGTLRPRGSKVAIKTFRLGPSNDAVPALKRVFQELHLWSKLSHENIVPLLGITTIFDFTVSIVSEWMGKGDAHSYIQNRSIDPRPLLVGIACGLNYLHSHPIFHGDLKGTNVLISDDGRALLCDFGLSFLVTSTFSMTVECRRGGSLPWTAPECLASDQWDVTAERDVWAFGMTTLEMFTREVPFHSSPNPMSVMVKISQGVPDRPSVESMCSRMTDKWWDLCLSCWNRDPFLRPSMVDIFDRVRALGRAV